MQPRLQGVTRVTPAMNRVLGLIARLAEEASLHGQCLSPQWMTCHLPLPQACRYAACPCHTPNLHVLHAEIALHYQFYYCIYTLLCRAFVVNRQCKRGFPSLGWQCVLDGVEIQDRHMLVFNCLGSVPPQISLLSQPGKYLPTLGKKRTRVFIWDAQMQSRSCENHDFACS